MSINLDPTYLSQLEEEYRVYEEDARKKGWLAVANSLRDRVVTVQNFRLSIERTRKTRSKRITLY